MDNIKCPVCGKVGIPDYHKSDVVCPQCGSDLSIYRIIDQIPTEPKKNIWKPISAVAFTAAAALGTMSLKPTLPTPITNSEYTQLQDSIRVLNSNIEDLRNNAKSLPQGYTYVVRKGESFWTISKSVYGTGSRYKEIADINGKNTNDVLHTGDTLIIK